MSDVERITQERNAQFKPARDAQFPARFAGRRYPRREMRLANWTVNAFSTTSAGCVERGVDAVAVSTAHGHSKGVGDTVRMLRDAFRSCRSLQEM